MMIFKRINWICIGMLFGGGATIIEDNVRYILGYTWNWSWGLGLFLIAIAGIFTMINSKLEQQKCTK